MILLCKKMLSTFLTSSKRYYSSLPSIPNSNKGHLSGARNTNKQVTTFKSSKHLSKAVNTNFVPNLNVSHNFIPTHDEKRFLLNLELTSDTGNSVKPLTFVCALDVSGSMVESVSKSGDTEVSKFSRLDLIKHSMNTIISCLRPEDKLALITFENCAKLVLPPTYMTEQGKIQADKQVQRFIANGGTNLWDGLDQSLNITENIDDVNNNKFALLLTDGEPNVNPPRGIHYEFMKKLPLKSSVNTFGYGYSLDSELLTSLATDGGGIFAHIPDYTMCNTVMINFLSNCLATALNNVTTSIKTNGCNTMFDNINVGPIQSGQVQNVIIPVKIDDPNNFNIDLSFNFDGSQLCYNINNLDKIKENYYQTMKYFLLEMIRNGIKTNDMQTTCNYLDNLINSIQNLKGMTSDKGEKEQLDMLLINIKHNDVHNGQIYKAFSNPDYYSRWGLHFLRYFIRSHELQVCSNFRDVSLQNYGGKLFKEIRAEVEEIFSSIPVPQPSLSSTPFQGNYQQSFYNNTGPCFEGHGIVQLFGHKVKFVKDLVKGDKIINSEGFVSTVVCLVKTKIKSGVTDMVSIGLFKVTPWHPIKYKGKFVFPFDVRTDGTNYVEAMKCDYVYNIVLDKHHIITIDGVDAVTLGHGFNDNHVTKHPFFGTSAVIEELKTFEGWSEGLVEINDYEKICDRDGLVASLNGKSNESNK